MRIALTAAPSAARFAPVVLRGPIAETFPSAAGLGYDGLEVHLRDPHDVDWDELAELSEHYGLHVPTLGTGMAAGMDGLTFPDPDPEVRRKAIDRVREHIKLAARLGSHVTIGSMSGRVGDAVDERSRGRERALACLAECCEAARDVGVTIVLEPLNRYEGDYLNTVQDVLDVIGELGAPSLGMLCDTYHMNIEEVDVAESLRLAGKHLGHVHLVDSNRQGPGRGHLRVREALRALLDIDYRGFVAFECLPLPNAETAARESLAHVRGLLTGLGS